MFKNSKELQATQKIFCTLHFLALLILFHYESLDGVNQLYIKHVKR